MQATSLSGPCGRTFFLRTGLPPRTDALPPATQVQRARAEEREHLAQELHDVLGGELTAARLQLAALAARLADQPPDVAQRLEQLNATLGALAALKRRIVAGLHPPALHSVGLAGALQAMARRVAVDAQIRLSIDVDDVRASQSTELAIFRLVQEALTNMVKHAGATEADILLRDRGREVCVFVRDNGRGFTVPAGAAGGHGLDGMRRRVEAAGGKLSVESEPGRGTRIAATLPKHTD